ncbi:hypothetical protein D8Y20_07275 [Mariprofundus sp. EBB-1]|uniref:hypothetical protein n=1 Tax=Mariprofundus sp. EBB-1 TaxID=2650971 RepID=UPI000EF225C5|nr:hypothetical protein [Mariprofundus sp. EBB-1]RLL52307.1 hypothetical protein D8Y20_07275 [Mariprofundus sp. EBB-1]
MKAEEVLNIWGAPDNSRLTAKQLSVRMPVHVAARVNALCDMHPNKTKTEIIGDLLSMALREIESAFPEHKGQQEGITPDGEPYYEDIGPHRLYERYANKHYATLEKELGNDNPRDLVTRRVVIGDSE